jgi:hypothetical protein
VDSFQWTHKKGLVPAYPSSGQSAQPAGHGTNSGSFYSAIPQISNPGELGGDVEEQHYPVEAVRATFILFPRFLFEFVFFTY